MDERERQLVEDLVTKARAGDREAFALLVERYSLDLTRFVRCLVGNPHDTQDVLQDAWLEAWRCRDQLRDSKAFRSWLFGIAKHRVERLRRGKRLLSPLDRANELVAPGDIREEAQSNEEVERLRQCLNRLRPEERKVIDLRFFENMTYEEVAAVTGRNFGAVHSRLHRVMHKLRRWTAMDA